jgi:nitrite reductase/ring-hydroxylating ferredoxin subunit/DMSO/TMAO reductase YedYZ heme-binding membrane subunit
LSTHYQAVQWNRQKRAYDAVLAAGVLAFLATFVGTGTLLFPDLTVETLLIRGVGSIAFVLFHIILCIGPLCRLMPRFLPLLYNRRHLGVTMFGLALVHGALSTIQFHALGDSDVLASVLSANPRLDSISQFPFQPFGLAALAILFAMAATSHDFWLANLTAPVWKALHMGVYLAYGLLVLHVGLGVLQSEPHPVYPVLVGLGMALVLGLHLAAARREHTRDATAVGGETQADGFVAFCRVDDIEEKRARVATLAGERVAVFRYDGKLSAVSNVCQHQNGPLGEGEIVDGCITCPWHGYQYEPHSGRSPAPFRERIPTFRLRVADGMVYVHPRPNPPGTPVEPATIPGAGAHPDG